MSDTHFGSDAEAERDLSAAFGIEALQDAAADLAEKLRLLRSSFEELGLGSGRDWANRELEGYPAGTTVSRYREVHCSVLGELLGPAGETEIAPLPTRHLSRGDRTVIRAGLADWSSSIGREGLRPENDAFVRDIDPQRHALYLRGLPADRARWCVLRAWESIAPSSLLDMLERIAEYGREMHEEAMRRRRGEARPRLARS